MRPSQFSVESGLSRNCLVETSHHHTFQNPFANIELDGFPYYCRFAIFCFSFALQSAPQFGADTGAYKTSPGTTPVGVRNRFPGLDWVNFPTSRMMILPIHALLFNSIEIFKAAAGRLLLHLSVVLFRAEIWPREWDVFNLYMPEPWVEFNRQNCRVL